MTKEFDNKERLRYYGIRVGDEVEERFHNKVVVKGVVVRLASCDNNMVYVEDKTGRVTGCVAEWLTILNKVEDNE